MKTKEQISSVFRESFLEKQGLIIAIEVAVSLLLLALSAKYGKPLTKEILHKVSDLLKQKQALQRAIETDDQRAEPNSESASRKAMLLNHLYLELADQVQLDWGHTAIQLLVYLPELLRHHGPKDG